MSKEKEEIKSLIASLGGKDWAARKEAMMKLVRIGRPAVKPLAAALREGNAELRYMVALILGKIGDAAATPYLAKAMADEDQRVRANVALALGELGGEEALPALIAALRDEAWWVRSCAADALGWSGDARAVGPLVAALKEEDRLAQETAALPAAEAQEQPRAEQVKVDDYTWAGVGESDIVREYAVRRTIIKALYRIGTPEALAAIQEYGE
jgi:HEAT repeat protein